jgi:hypothetical protein
MWPLTFAGWIGGSTLGREAGRVANIVMKKVSASQNKIDENTCPAEPQRINRNVNEDKGYRTVTLLFMLALYPICISPLRWLRRSRGVSD